MHSIQTIYSFIIILNEYNSIYFIFNLIVKFNIKYKLLP